MSLGAFYPKTFNPRGQARIGEASKTKERARKRWKKTRRQGGIKQGRWKGAKRWGRWVSIEKGKTIVQGC